MTAVATEAVEYVRSKMTGLCEGLYRTFERSAEQVDDMIGADLSGPSITGRGPT